MSESMAVYELSNCKMSYIQHQCLQLMRMMVVASSLLTFKSVFIGSVDLNIGLLHLL